jgi:hypothetical protein
MPCNIFIVMKACGAVNQKASLKSEGLLVQVTKRKDYKSNCRKAKFLREGRFEPEGVKRRLHSKFAFSVSNSKAKGQLVFEFIIAMVIFFGIIIYALNYLGLTMVGYSSDSSAENMESEASQIGELLVLNRGNWSGGNPITVGLAQEWPVLNSTKISWLNSSCNSPSGYDSLMEMLDLPPKHRLKLTITETLPSGAVSVKADCMWGLPISSNAAKAEVRRYALSEAGNVLAVYVGVWTTGK